MDSIISLLLLSATAWSQSKSELVKISFEHNNDDKQISTKSKTNSIESGKFHLFIWKLPVGEENYTVERLGKSTVLKSHFEYSYKQKKGLYLPIYPCEMIYDPKNLKFKGTLWMEQR